LEESLVVLDSEKRGIRWNALRFKRCETTLFDHRWKVLSWRLITDLEVGLPSDEAQIRDIVRFATRLASLEDCLRKDVVKLQPVLGYGMVEGYGDLRSPVLSVCGPERKEHRLGERAALTAPLSLARQNPESE